MILAKKATISWVRMGTYVVTNKPVKLTGICRASVHVTFLNIAFYLVNKAAVPVKQNR